MFFPLINGVLKADKTFSFFLLISQNFWILVVRNEFQVISSIGIKTESITFYPQEVRPTIAPKWVERFNFVCRGVVAEALAKF